MIIKINPKSKIQIQIVQYYIKTSTAKDPRAKEYSTILIMMRL